MVRKTIFTRVRRLLQPSAALAYTVILVRILDAIQRADFVGRVMGAQDVLVFVRDWGWIAGLAWLAYLVLAPSKEETLHAVNVERLRRELVSLVLRIERLLLLYEMPEFNSSAHQAALADRRSYLFKQSMAHLLSYVLAGVPKEYRKEYELGAVAGAMVDLIDTPQEQLSALAREDKLSITSGLDLYLEWQRGEEAENRSKLRRWFRRRLGR